MRDVVRSVTLGTESLSKYEHDGFLVIENLINPLALPGIRDEVFEILMAETGLSREELLTARSTEERLRQSQAYLEGSMIDELINGSQMHSIASQLIGGPAVRYNPFTALKGIGGGTFDFHQDNNYTEHRPPLSSINIWVALVDMSVENGCLRIVPGSHKVGTLGAIDAGDAVHRKLDCEIIGDIPVEVRAGDAIAFTRLTVHGSGPNTTLEPRLAYALQYHREDTQFLCQPDNEWRSLIDFPRFRTPPLLRLPTNPR